MRPMAALAGGDYQGRYSSPFADLPASGPGPGSGRVDRRMSGRGGQAIANPAAKPSDSGGYCANSGFCAFMYPAGPYRVILDCRY